MIVLDYISLNKGRIVADIALNTLHSDMFLKQLQLCGTSQNQIYFNQLQHIFKAEKESTLGYKYIKMPLSTLLFMNKILNLCLFASKKCVYW